jgi:hypothetical protein
MIHKQVTSKWWIYKTKLHTDTYEDADKLDLIIIAQILSKPELKYKKNGPLPRSENGPKG